MNESDSPEGYLDQGRRSLDEGNPERALALFRDGYVRDPGNAKLRSYYGLCIGLVERRFQEAVELCRSAARQEFFNPDLYLNLARVHLSFGFKTEGMRYLQRGKMIDPAHGGIDRELAELGRRTPPIIQFLPRRHIVNRCLGMARHYLVRRAVTRALV